jgi:hypothetical protein
MATNHSNQTWPISDLTFVEISAGHPLQTQMHVAFECGIRVVISQRDQIPLAAELIEYLRERQDRREGGVA